MELPGYRVEELLHEDGRWLLLRGRSETDLPVLLRTPCRPQASLAEVACCQNAFELGRQADRLCVARPLEILRLPGSLALVCEDPGGGLLTRSIPSGGLRLAALMDLAAALAASLARLHGCGILHRAVSPASLIVDLEAPSARFVSLDLASRLKRELGAAAPLGQTEGLLGYLSPEQFGRLDSPVDDRADLYSLGVTLFEIASGRLPFEQEDPASLVHAHVAVPAPPLSTLRPDIPEAFCAIVARLLRKNTDERYASAGGLLRDLKHCAAEFGRSGTVRIFELGADDVSPRFRLPDRLYGRESQTARLLEAWDGTRQGRRSLVCIAGPSGIGKTALAGWLHGPVSAQGGRFGAGKFDQFQRDQPYLPFVEATRSLLRRELAAPEPVLEQRRRDLSHAVGRYGRLLTDAFPELQAIIGPQPEVEPAPPSEAARRFNGVVSRFLGVFATEQAPLVLFLDDLQWADPASLNLLEALAQDVGLRHLMIVLGYRSGELEPGHPARQTLDQMRACALDHVEIALAPLSPGDITALLADALQEHGELVETLALQVHRASAGNAFFARELLEALHERGCFAFDRAAGRWRFALDDLARRGVPDDLAGLMTDRLAELADDTLDLLHTASCIGSQFDLLTVARVHQVRQSDAAAGLAPAVIKGLLVPLDPSYRLFETLAAWDLEPGQADGLGTPRYRFLHDQVRLAVHGRLDARRRAERHLRIGRLLLASLPPDELEAGLVALFGHLIWAADLITDPDERLAFARLGLRAGRKARLGLAFDTARAQLQAARGLLPDEPWSVDYETALGIHLALAECAFALGDTAQLEALAQHVLDRVRDPVDAARVHGLRIRFLSTEGRYDEAADICVAVAAGLGVPLPRKPRVHHLLYHVARALRAQGGRPPENFEELPECGDRALREAVNLLSQAAGAAYFAEPALLPLIGIICSRLSIERGLTPASPYGFAVWALVLCGMLHRIDAGYRFGTLATRLGRRYGGADEARARFVVAAFVRHWKEPLKEVAAALAEDWRLNRDAGDEENAVYSGGVLLYTDFLAGTAPDADLRHREIVDYIAAAHKPHVQASFLAWVQLLESLREQELPDELTGRRFDYPTELQGFEADSNGVQIAISSIAAGILDHLAGRYERAEQRLALAARWEANIVGQVLVPALAFFRSLNAYRLASARPGDAWLLAMARRQARRVRRWARHAPANQTHRLSLLDAEELRRRGHPGDAILELHRAAGSAAAQDAPLYQALAESRLQELFVKQGDMHAAQHAGLRACERFEAWGAPALARALRYGSGLPALAGHLSGAAALVSGGGTEALDLKSLIEAVAAISSEVDESALLNRLMRAILQATNADRGLLIRPDDEGRARVEVEARVGAGSTTAPCALDDYTNLARGPVDLALRSQRSVAVQDAAGDELTRDDRHVAASGVRALLVVCLSVRGRLGGVVYLENEVARGAFPAARIELAETLAAEAGIALENARLFREAQEALQTQVRLTEANRRFVPGQILSSLGFDSIVDVNLNAATERAMAVLFADLRDFTRLSSDIGPQRTIAMVNRYLSHVQPGIAANRGFVANYLGDGLLALFPDGADDALRGAVAMSRGLQGYNRERGDLPRLRFGLGLHSGPVVLGTIGDLDHLQCGVIGDAVNTASRVEALTKHFQAALLLSEEARAALETPEAFSLRYLGQVGVAGRVEPLSVYECLDDLAESQRLSRLEARPRFEHAVSLFQAGDWSEAAALFAACADGCPDDDVARAFESRCRSRAENAIGWDGVERVAKVMP